MSIVLASAELLDSPVLDAAGQMALDEVLLDEGCEASLRFFRWAGAAVTFGYFQAHAEAKAIAEAAGLGSAPLVRRLTGGGAVLHDGDLTFSWVFAWPSELAPQAIYKNLHRSVHLGLKTLGLKTALWSPGPVKGCAPESACFAGKPAAMDLILEDGRKLLGGALRKRRGFGLYQGSLDAKALGRSPAELEAALARGLFEGREPLRAAAEAGLLERARDLAKLRYGSDDWNLKR